MPHWSNLGNIKGRALKMPGMTIDKARVKVISKSNRTSEVTVQFLEAKGAYKVGDRIVVKPYEIEGQ